MTKKHRFAISVADLDRLNLCGLYSGVGQIWKGQPVLRERLLEMTARSKRKKFTLADVLVSGVWERDGKVVPLRQTLTPIAQIAQSDEEVRRRLTGFINDCAIEALPAFETHCPSDIRPRTAILATQNLLAGKLAHDEWVTIVRGGLIAWAGWFAPQALYASAEWAAWENRSWLPESQRIEEAKNHLQNFAIWQDWAEWASLNLLIFLGKDYHKRVTPHLLDEGNDDLHRWATKRLAEWLQPEDPTPFQPHAETSALGTAIFREDCSARYVEEFADISWPVMTVFPQGLEEIGSVRLERNAVFSVPEGVAHIGKISMSDHPTIELPKSLRTIGSIDAYSDCLIRIPEGVTRIGSIRIASECQVFLPSTIEFVGEIDADAESYLEDMGLDDFESEDDYWKSIEEAEGNTEPDYYGCFVQCANRRIIKGRTNIRFVKGDPQAT